MSTQHPDNVNSPFFAARPELAGEDEIKEAFYAFSHLNCDEQMWDCEGKETDTYVVKKLLTKYSNFFKENEIGKDLNLTFRVPNPTVERAEAKVLLETLEGIPRSHDSAKLFYKNDNSPIFEVILPMTSSAQEINRIYHYYKDFVAGKEEAKLADTTIGKWIGNFQPKAINVIPLFESYEHMIAAADITKEYLKDKNPEYQRTFLARSDPAMNYGNITAVILNKIALKGFLDGLAQVITGGVEGSQARSPASAPYNVKMGANPLQGRTPTSSPTQKAIKKAEKKIEKEPEDSPIVVGEVADKKKILEYLLRNN